MFVNPHIFFFLKDGEIIAWDYKNHQQFALEKLYFDRLVDRSKAEELETISLDNELAEGDLLCTQKPSQEEWGWDVLAEIYHIGTRDIATNLGELDPQQWSKEYLEYCQGISQEAPEFHTKREGEKLKLPNPDLELLKNQNFLEVVKARKTCRSFNGGPVSLEYLATLLYVSLGPLHDKWQDLEDNDLMVLGVRKAFPSGGGIHPEEAYVVIFNVEGIKPGVYHYDAEQHSLTVIKTGEFEKEVIELLLGQFFAKGLAFGIFLTSRFDKIWWKYPHSRAYRVALLDIGHASQTILLTATALGLQTWLTGAFYDSKVEEFLEIKTSNEASIFFVGVGHGDNQSIPPEILKILQEKS